jgi:hypothetical protein
MNSNVNIEYLDRLARQLKVGKNPACCRAINRILAEMKKRSRNGEYRNHTGAESAFRKCVEGEPTCQKSEISLQLRIDDLVPQGVPNQFAKRVTVQAPHNVGAMSFHGFNAHPESNSNLLTGLAFGQ